jgi:hypothetical protein
MNPVNFPYTKFQKFVTKVSPSHYVWIGFGVTLRPSPIPTLFSFYEMEGFYLPFPFSLSSPSLPPLSSTNIMLVI